MLGIYLVGGWIAFQVVQTFTEGLGLPDWFPALALGLLIVLLPVVLATAFVQEGVDGGAGQPEAAATSETESAEPEPTGEATEAEVRRGADRVFTWRNAILAGLAMLALLAVSGTGYMGLRAAGIGPFGTLLTKGVLEERDRIVLVDFENRTSDSLLAVVAIQLFRTALSQSTAVNVAGQEYVAGVLRRMGREADAPLDYHLAREVAVRQGLKAITAGEVIEVGGGYVVSARLVVAETGEELWTDSETARDSTAIIDSIDRLSSRLRERIGESLRTIRGNKPLARVTTSSLEALQKYTQGSRAIRVEGDFDKGVGLLLEAVALDTAFAAAYLTLGWAAALGEEWTYAVEAITNAYRHRDRLTDRERYVTIGSYYNSVTGKHEKAITAFRTLLDSYPGESYGLFLLGVSYTTTRQHARAVEVYHRAIELDSANALAYRILFGNQMSLGDLQGAQATLDLMTENDNPYSFNAAAWHAFAREDYEGAEASLRAEMGWRRWAVSDLAGVARLRGKLAEAERGFGEAMAGCEADGWGRHYLSEAVRLALLRLQLGDGVERAIQTVENALERHPLATIPVLDRPHAELAEFYAIAGRLDRARATLAERDSAIDPPLGWRTEWRRHLAEGYIALAEGRHLEAIAEFRSSDDRSMNLCRWCALPPLADAYDLAGEADSAVAVHERYLGGVLFGGDEVHAASRYLPSIYERLGALYEARGELARAIHYYGKLVELWQDADPELQPRVEAARRAIEVLSPDT
ncbi:MAG: tetratricopeptide repeat protein [Gemmatimonadota bacterium]|nr:MAG: tetratricopeptide repeat protein [Gemmatimonadota bacterium]